MFLLLLLCLDSPRFGHKVAVVGEENARSREEPGMSGRGMYVFVYIYIYMYICIAARSVFAGRTAVFFCLNRFAGHMIRSVILLCFGCTKCLRYTLCLFVCLFVYFYLFVSLRVSVRAPGADNAN